MQQDFNQGNFKDAYEGFRKLALDPAGRSPAGGRRPRAWPSSASQRLNRVDEIDALLEDAIKVHKDELAAAVAAPRKTT